MVFHGTLRPFLKLKSSQTSFDDFAAHEQLPRESMWMGDSHHKCTTGTICSSCVMPAWTRIWGQCFQHLCHEGLNNLRRKTRVTRCTYYSLFALSQSFYFFFSVLNYANKLKLFNGPGFACSLIDDRLTTEEAASSQEVAGEQCLAHLIENDAVSPDGLRYNYIFRMSLKTYLLHLISTQFYISYL